VIDVRLLGPPEVRIDGAAAPRMLMRRKNLTLFLYLACAGKRGRSQDQLIGVLWPDKPQTKARRSVTVALSTLRSCLGPGIVLTEAAQSWIDPAVLRLDTDQLDALTKTGRWREANALLTDRGFLEGFGSDVSAYEDWLGTERRIWNRRILEVRLHVGEDDLRAGDIAAAIEAAQHARRIDRLSEPAVVLLMRARMLEGDRAGALGEYEAFVTLLREELGTDASAGLRRRRRTSSSRRAAARRSCIGRRSWTRSGSCGSGRTPAGRPPSRCSSVIPELGRPDWATSSARGCGSTAR
jgi:DNA-binding SARP family transcriptional activator